MLRTGGVSVRDDAFYNSRAAPALVREVAQHIARVASSDTWRRSIVANAPGRAETLDRV